MALPVKPLDLLEGVPFELSADERLLVAAVMALAIVADRNKPRNITAALERELLRWAKARGKTE